MRDRSWGGGGGWTQTGTSGGNSSRGRGDGQQTLVRGLRASHVWVELCAVSLRGTEGGTSRRLLPDSGGDPFVFGWGWALGSGRAARGMLVLTPPPSRCPSFVWLSSVWLPCLFPCRCWPSWGSPASGASRTCLGWRRRLWAQCHPLPAPCCCCFPSRPR